MFAMTREVSVTAEVAGVAMDPEGAEPEACGSDAGRPGDTSEGTRGEGTVSVTQALRKRRARSGTPNARPAGAGTRRRDPERGAGGPESLGRVLIVRGWAWGWVWGRAWG